MNRIDLSRGTQSEVGLRQLDWTYYDTLTMATGTLSNRLFTAGLGVGGKSLWQTNLKGNGVIPTGESMEVHSIRINYTSSADIATTALTYLYNMLCKTTAEVKIAGAESVLTVTLQELMGLNLAVSQTLVTTYANAGIPYPIFTGEYKLKRPITFAENQTVEVLVTHQVAANSALDGHFLRIGLHGVLTRRLA